MKNREFGAIWMTNKRSLYVIDWSVMWEVLQAPSYQCQPESLLDEKLYKEMSLFKNEDYEVTYLSFYA